MAVIEIIANGNVACDNGNGNDDNDDATMLLMMMTPVICESVWRWCSEVR